MPDAPPPPLDEPADSPEEEVVETRPETVDEVAAPAEPTPSAQPETVGTGSYLAVSCVAGMGLLLLLLIAGLLLSRWLG